MADLSDIPAPGAPAPVYFNGKFLPAEEARLPVDDLGVLFGLGFFESFRTSGGRLHHWPRHRRRLEQACARAGVTLPADFLASDEAKLQTVVVELLQRRGLADAVFRYTVTAGAPEERPNEFLRPRALPPAAPAQGVALRVLALRRDNGEWVPRPKSLNYANALLGAEELRRRGAPVTDEGLFLSRDGWVVETPRQAVAWIKDEELCHADPELGAIAGTALEWAVETIGQARPCRVTLDTLCTADAVFVVNTVRGVTPVATVWDETDTRQLAAFESAAHPMIVGLQARWQEALEATARS